MGESEGNNVDTCVKTVVDERRTTQFLPNGRFAKGNKVSVGNPLNKKTQQLRAALINALTEQDIVDIAFALIKKAKKGDTVAAREVFDRTFGKAHQSVEISTTEVHRQIEELTDDDLLRIATEASETRENNSPVSE